MAQLSVPSPNIVEFCTTSFDRHLYTMEGESVMSKSVFSLTSLQQDSVDLPSVTQLQSMDRLPSLQVRAS